MPYLLCQALQKADEELLCVMLGVTLEVGAVFLEDPLERTGVDRLVLGSLRGKIDLGYLLDEKFFFRTELLLFKIVAEGRRPYEALDHCIHIARVANIIEPSQLVDLPFLPELSGVELLEGLTVDYL